MLYRLNNPDPIPDKLLAWIIETIKIPTALKIDTHFPNTNNGLISGINIPTAINNKPSRITHHANPELYAYAYFFILTFCRPEANKPTNTVINPNTTDTTNIVMTSEVVDIRWNGNSYPKNEP